MKKFLYFIVLYVFSVCHAGSYDDYFKAIQFDDAATVSQLLRRGFDANTPNPQGENPLLLALRTSSLKVAAVLIAWPQTTVESRNTNDESPLMLAALKGQLQLVEQLIAREADVNKPGWTPLHYAATAGQVAVIRLLLENDAYIDASSPNGSTPLMLAAMYGTASAVKLLLEEGADPMLTNERGLTAQNFAQQAKRDESAAIIGAFVAARLARGN
ncbi:MAG: ankyrin repeat domain-containing protein [Burkholderiaceae bacterium]